MRGQVVGVDTNFKTFLSVCYNPLTKKYDVCKNGYIKSISARTYDVNSDYDFGAIDPIDIAIEMYIEGSEKDSGVSLRK